MTDRIAPHAAPKTPAQGQRLEQPAFNVLYKAMPTGTLAELIGGVVRQ